MQPLFDYIDHTVRRLNPWSRPPVATPETAEAQPVTPAQLPTLHANPNVLGQRVGQTRDALAENDTPETRDAYRDAVALLQYRRLLGLSDSFGKVAREVHGRNREICAGFVEEAHALTRLSSDYWRRPPADETPAKQWVTRLVEEISTRSDGVCELLEQRGKELTELARNHRGRVRALAAEIEAQRAEQIDLAGTPVASDRVMNAINPAEVSR